LTNKVQQTTLTAKNYNTVASSFCSTHATDSCWPTGHATAC